MALVLLSSCRKQEQPAQSTPQARIKLEEQPPASTSDTQHVQAPLPTASLAPKGELLRVKWPVGNRYVYRLELEQQSTNQVPTTPESTTENLAIGMSYALSVLTETDGGGRDLELEFLSLEMQISMAGQVVISFDTAAKLEQETSSPVPGPFRRLIGSKVRLKADRDGKVEAVVGLDDWVRAVVGDSTGPAAEMLAQQFNEGFFQQVADFGRGLPSRAVEAGENWPFQNEVPAGTLGRIIADSTITFSRWDEHEAKRLAVLVARGSLKNVPDEKADRTAALLIEGGKIDSDSWFDPQLGALVESAVVQSMQLKSKAPAAQAAAGAPSAFISDIRQKVTVKLVELSEAGNNRLDQ